jgi:hypothetical protein
MAVASSSRGPVTIEPLPVDDAASVPAAASDATVPVPVSMAPAASEPRAQRKRPPRVRKPSPNHDQLFADTTDTEAERAALRRAFGDTLSDEFVAFVLGTLIAVLRPGPFDKLKEATLNAAIAVISSLNPQTELQALLAVQIVAAGFTGLKFLRQSQVHMDEIYIGVYGGYANKLFRPLTGINEETSRRLKFGTSTSIQEPRGWSESSTPPKRERGMAKNDTQPHASGGHCTPTGKFSQIPPVRGQDPRWPSLQAGGCERSRSVPNARRG